MKVEDLMLDTTPSSSAKQEKQLTTVAEKNRNQPACLVKVESVLSAVIGANCVQPLQTEPDLSKPKFNVLFLLNVKSEKKKEITKTLKGVRIEPSTGRATTTEKIAAFSGPGDRFFEDANFMFGQASYQQITKLLTDYGNQANFQIRNDSITNKLCISFVGHEGKILHEPIFKNDADYEMDLKNGTYTFESLDYLVELLKTEHIVNNPLQKKPLSNIKGTTETTATCVPRCKDLFTCDLS